MKTGRQTDRIFRHIRRSIVTDRDCVNRRHGGAERINEGNDPGSGFRSCYAPDDRTWQAYYM